VKSPFLIAGGLYSITALRKTGAEDKVYSKHQELLYCHNIVLICAWGYGVGFGTLYFFGRFGGISFRAPCVFHPTPNGGAGSVRALLFELMALFIILTGNQCAICGKRLLLW